MDHIDSADWIEKQKSSNKSDQWKRKQMLSIHCTSRVKSWRNKKKDSQRITKIKPFIDKYIWDGINFPSE